MGLHAALAVHPDSGMGAAARIAGTVAHRLRRHVDRLDLLAANTVEHYRALLAESRAAGLDVLVVVGGDGAAHQAVQFCAGTDIALGVVPAGTGNDLARALGMPADPLTAVDAVVAGLRQGRTHRIDLGRAGDTWFSTVLCAGFDAAVNERANRWRYPRGPRRYDLAILAELASFRSREVCIRTEAGVHELRATLVAVGNTAWYGGGVPICPDARPDDGVFDVTVVGQATRRELIRMLPSLRSGRHLDHPAVTTLRAREVSLSGIGWPAYADGEPLGTLPVSVNCVPRALAVLG
ncbi:diacylglycerol/lipid kinase family protein [Prauserella oleivorans]|uniref:Diacylglycerol/lipid kinase family protein n=1 Tax=Prauserella oleivorans TaxID=1478153 RepID=A0ABW5WAE7_9PSEU